MLPKAAFDANCFIDAVRTDLPSGQSVRQLIGLATSRRLTICVSRHTITELEAGSLKDAGAALNLAMGFPLLPYRPIGVIDDLVGTIQDLPGTFDDWRAWSLQSDSLRQDLQRASSIRDLGALFDAVEGHCTVFVTSDRHLCAPTVTRDIAAHWAIVVMTPAAAAQSILAPEA